MSTPENRQFLVAALILRARGCVGGGVVFLTCFYMFRLSLYNGWHRHGSSTCLWRLSSLPILPCVRAFSLPVEGGHRQRPSRVGYAYELRRRSPARGLSVQVPTPVSPQVTTACSRILPMPLMFAPAVLATKPSVAVGAFGFPDLGHLFQLTIGQNKC